MPNELLKLDVGCGPNPRSGYKGVDIRKLPNVTYVCASWELEQHVELKTVAEIYSYHFFEHLTFQQGLDTLKVFSRILKSGGRLEMLLPDIAMHMAQYLARPRVDQRWAEAGLWGWQTSGDVAYWDVHKSGYDYDALNDVLAKSGFISIERISDDPKHLHIVAFAP